MKAQKSRHAELLKPVKKAPRYTPVSRRQDRPDAIAWFLRNHPEVPDSQVARLLGTTKATIDQVRNRPHWNSANIKPVDPVTLGLSTQMELDAVVGKAAEKRLRAEAGPTLLPAAATTEQAEAKETPEPAKKPGGELDVRGRCLPSSSSSAAASRKTRASSFRDAVGRAKLRAA